MHPISKSHFGSNAGQIACHFSNGSSTVSGYIVKQTGTKRFQVTADGANTFVCALTTNSVLAAGDMTIYVYPYNSNGIQDTVNSVEHASGLTMNYVYTREGNEYIWSDANSTALGHATLELRS